MQSLLADRQHKPSKNVISSTAGADPNLLKEPKKILDILVVEVSVERAYILRQRSLILFDILLFCVIFFSAYFRQSFGNHCEMHCAR